MTFKRLSVGSFCAALIIVTSAWVLHSFLEALLASCVIAVASWPLYRAFSARMPRRTPRTTTSLIFVALMAVFVLAPLTFFAFWSRARNARPIAGDEKG
jgi:predicted PurR-regulated permease PerM